MYFVSMMVIMEERRVGVNVYFENNFKGEHQRKRNYDYREATLSERVLL